MVKTGSKKRRTIRAYKRRVKRSKCKKMKRRTCKASKSCKWASGKKRNFCRKRKSRKVSSKSLNLTRRR